MGRTYTTGYMQMPRKAASRLLYGFAGVPGVRTRSRSRHGGQRRYPALVTGFAQSLNHACGNRVVGRVVDQDEAAGRAVVRVPVGDTGCASASRHVADVVAREQTWRGLARLGRDVPPVVDATRRARARASCGAARSRRRGSSGALAEPAERCTDEARATEPARRAPRADRRARCRAVGRGPATPSGRGRPAVERAVEGHDVGHARRDAGGPRRDTVSPTATEPDSMRPR